MREDDRRRPSTTSRLLAGLLTTACAASVAFAAPPAPQLSELRARATAALQAGDRGQAAAHLTRAAHLAPDPGLWRLVGDLEISQDEPDRAVDAWRAGLALAPDDPSLLDRLARVASVRGDWDAAMRAQRRLVEVFSDRAPGAADKVILLDGAEQTPAQRHRRSLAVLSELAVLAGDYTTAEEAARALIMSWPAAADGHLALGYVFLQARDFAEAADAYVEALALDPDNPVARNNLGTIAYMNRDLKGAAAQFEAVLDSAARTPVAESIALANLGEVSQLSTRIAEAEYLYGQATEAFPHGAWSYMGRAALYDMTGRHDEAIDAMIDGWERDANGLTRLNMHFFQPEWAWQRDALIAEIEGDLDYAAKLWARVARGEVEALRESAAHHLASIELLLAD